MLDVGFRRATRIDAARVDEARRATRRLDVDSGRSTAPDAVRVDEVRREAFDR